MMLQAQTGPHPGAECAPGLTPSLGLGHPQWRPAGGKVPNGHMEILQWGTLSPGIGICTIGADHSGTRVDHQKIHYKVRCIPRLPLGDPPGMSHLH